jgi:hypothetical protein
MIELISELYLSNIIDQSGKFKEKAVGVVERNGEKSYCLFLSGTKELLLTEHEIELSPVEGCYVSFLYVFVKSLGLTFRILEGLYYERPGLRDKSRECHYNRAPDMPRDKFILLAARRSVERRLLDGLIAQIENIMPMITYREMNENQDLMNVLQGAFFIPHTEPDLLKG